MANQMRFLNITVLLFKVVFFVIWLRSRSDRAFQLEGGFNQNLYVIDCFRSFTFNKQTLDARNENT